MENENQCWKEIARKKTQILMKYLPDYNPLLSGGSDSENLEGCLKKIIEENKKLKEENKRLEQCHEWNKSAALQLNDAKAEMKKLKSLLVTMSE